MILAIDPGNKESGFVYLNNDLSVVDKGKIDNEDLLECIQSEDFDTNSYVAIEMIASYGMPVGAEVFETCIWIGRFIQALKCHYNKEPKLIFRKDEKINICKSPKANDATIKQALIDRFAKGQKNYGKGSKKEPGWFYGFSKDIWSAYAVGVTFYDMYLKPNE
jgi:hypothetical protein